MADQAVNALPTKTAPSTGDKMLMIGTAEEYQIDYDQLASAILDKLSTKQYGALATTAKTVLGALDELNSKTNDLLIKKYDYGELSFEKSITITLDINDSYKYIPICVFEAQYGRAITITNAWSHPDNAHLNIQLANCSSESISSNAIIIYLARSKF